MDFDADINACAALVQKGDPARFRTVMAAPVAARAILFPIYAMNVEIARAPWVTQEPMIAEMRLQWWRDALEEIAQGKPARRHEVVSPLARILSPQSAEMLDELVAARRWDIYKDPFEDAAHLERYLDQTSGHLMIAALRALGGSDESVARDAAYGSGVAAWLRAVPALEAAKHVPLLDGRLSGVAALAQEGLDRLTRARKHRSKIVKAARPALWPCVAATGILRQAIHDPASVGEGTLAERPGNLAWAVLSGRW